MSRKAFGYGEELPRYGHARAAYPGRPAPGLLARCFGRRKEKADDDETGHHPSHAAHGHGHGGSFRVGYLVVLGLLALGAYWLLSGPGEQDSLTPAALDERIAAALRGDDDVPKRRGPMPQKRRDRFRPPPTEEDAEQGLSEDFGADSSNGKKKKGGKMGDDDLDLDGAGNEEDISGLSDDELERLLNDPELDGKENEKGSKRRKAGSPSDDDDRDVGLDSEEGVPSDLEDDEPSPAKHKKQTETDNRHVKPPNYPKDSDSNGDKKGGNDTPLKADPVPDHTPNNPPPSPPHPPPNPPPAAPHVQISQHKNQPAHTEAKKDAIPQPDSTREPPPKPQPLPPPPPPSVPQFYRDTQPGPNENEPYAYTGPPNPDGIKLNPVPIPKDEAGVESVRKIAGWAWSGWWNVCIAPHIPANGTVRERIAAAKLQTKRLQYDEIRPLQKVCHDWAGLPPFDGREMATNSMILTAVDSISTLYLLNMTKELEEAMELVLSWDFRVDYPVSVFETVIRVLGGLLSGWTFTGNYELVLKAESVGLGLLGAFGWNQAWESTDPKEWKWEQPLGLANLKHSRGQPHGDLGAGQIRISELGTLQLEFQFLADALPTPRREKFQSLVDFINQQIRFMETELADEGLWPKRMGRVTRSGPGRKGALSDYQYAVGGEIDSFYEYLLKIWAVGGGALDGHKVDGSVKMEDDLHPRQGDVDWARRMWDRSAKGMERAMLARFVPAKRTGQFVQPFRPGGDTHMDDVKFHALFATSSPQGAHGQQLEHLACFAPGMFAFGASNWPYPSDQGKKEMWDWAVDTADTCFRMYWDSPTGLGCESVSVKETPIRPYGGNYYILRPEVLESVFYVHRLSGGADGRYRRWARYTVAALEKHCRMDTGGYTGLQDVSQDPNGWIQRGDNQETFFLAELIKYLYLIFAGSEELDLTQYVFNTEAHPLPVRGSKRYMELMRQVSEEAAKQAEKEQKAGQGQGGQPAVVAQGNVPGQ